MTLCNLRIIRLLMFWAFAQEIKLFEDKNYIFSRLLVRGKYFFTINLFNF